MGIISYKTTRSQFLLDSSLAGMEVDFDSVFFHTKFTETEQAIAKSGDTAIGIGQPSIHTSNIYDSTSRVNVAITALGLITLFVLVVIGSLFFTKY